MHPHVLTSSTTWANLNQGIILPIPPDVVYMMNASLKMIAAYHAMTVDATTEGDE